MLLLGHIVNALQYHEIATSRHIGDTIGEDKFRVLKIMRRLEQAGVVVSFWGSQFESDRKAADYQYFMCAKVI